MKQPRQTDKQTGKRIVSKGEYAKMCAIKSLLMLSASATFGYGLWNVFRLIRRLSDRPAGTPFILVVIGVCTVVIMIGGGILVLLTSMRVAKDMKIGVPLTRANTADLPAPDSLVRASSEPIQEQQSVLLRAATETQERHEEQLVRAVGGPE